MVMGSVVGVGVPSFGAGVGAIVASVGCGVGCGVGASVSSVGCGVGCGVGCSVGSVGVAVVCVMNDSQTSSNPEALSHPSLSPQSHSSITTSPIVTSFKSMHQTNRLQYIFRDQYRV